MWIAEICGKGLKIRLKKNFSQNKKKKKKKQKNPNL